MSELDPSSRGPSQGDDSLPAKIGGTLLLAIFAIPFGHEGAKRALDGDYLTACVAFLIAGVLAVTAVVWLSSRSFRSKLGDMATSLKWWFAVFSVVLLYFGISHIQWGRQGPVGPQGLRGERGIPGPEGQPGISPSSSAEFNATARIALALARAYAFKLALPKFDELFKQYCDTTSNVLSIVPPFNPQSSMMKIDYERQLFHIERSIKNMSSADFGDQINLDLHPNFDNNHFFKATGGPDNCHQQPDFDKISDPYEAEEYRKKADKFLTAKSLIQNERQKYAEEIAREESVITQATMRKP